MVTKIIAFRISIFIARAIRFALGCVSMLLQMPFFFAVTVIIGIGWLGYRLFGWNRLMVRSLKVLIRFSFLFRGVHIQYQLPDGKSFDSIQGLNICNHGSNIYWILFSVLPYDHLIVPVDEFFSAKSYRSLLFVLGFIPQEHGITPESMESFESRIQPYIEQDFSFWQPCFFDYRDTEPLPYLLLMALKFNQSINIWSVKGLDHLTKVSWIRRVWIRIELISTVAISRRLPVTIAAYEQCLVQNFGPPESEKFATQNRPSGLPPSNTEIAKQKIATAKKQLSELENEGLSQ